VSHSLTNPLSGGRAEMNGISAPKIRDFNELIQDSLFFHQSAGRAGTLFATLELMYVYAQLMGPIGSAASRGRVLFDYGSILGASVSSVLEP